MKKGWENRRRFAGYLFAGPWILGFLFFTVYPLLFSLYASFTRWTFSQRIWTGISNYKLIFTDSEFWRCALNTLIYSVVSTPLTLVFAMFLALLLHQKLKGIKFFRALYFLPVVAASDVISTAAGNLIFGRIIVLNLDLTRFGIQLSENARAFVWFAAMIFTLGLWRTGIQMLIFLMGLENVSPDLYEAAEIDGATGWQKFWWVTIPAISPMIILNILLTIVESFTGIATTMQLLTRGRYSVFIWDYINFLAFRDNDFGLALAVVWVFILTLLTTIIILFKKMDRKVSY